MLNSAKLIDRIRDAIAYGHAAAYAADPLDVQRIKLGNSSFDFIESEPYLASSVRHCLFAEKQPKTMAPDVIVYADYTGWHLENGFEQALFGERGLLEVCSELRQIGIHISYYEPLQRWDILDRNSSFGIRLQQSPEASPDWEKTAPLANFCNWIAAVDGLTMLHAASVGIYDSGALLVGDSGAGKSGTTLGALLEGFSSAGDDYILVSSGPEYIAHAVYTTVKQDTDGLARLGLTSDQPLNWQNKMVCTANKLTGKPISRTVPVKALILPEIGADKTTFEAGYASEIFKTLTFSTLRQLAADHETVFKTCGQMVRSLPCYKMRMSPDNSEIANALKGFLGKLEHAQC